jgi:DNA-directed RNA polymerase subunit K/omega
MHNLNKFELARVIGARALQLSYGAPPLVEVKPGESAIDVAKKEFEAGVIPFVVIR